MTCLEYITGSLAAAGRVYTKGAWAAPVLLLDLSPLQALVLYLDVSAKQGSEQHLGESEQLEP